MSVYLGSLLTALGLAPEDALECHDGFGLCVFPVAAARDAGFGVVRDPVLAPERPLKVDGAHALLTGEPPSGKPAVKRGRRLVMDPRLEVIVEPSTP